MTNKNDGLPFGRKVSEVVAEEQAKANAPATEPANEPVVIDPAKGTEPAKVEPKVEPKTEPKVEPPKVDWLGEVNKVYKSEFKTPEEFGTVFEKAKKVDEYGTKITEFTNNETKYKTQLEKLQSSLKEVQNPLNYFSSQEAFIAEQLKKQYPDLNSSMLHTIATSDSKGMTDIDVLVKNKLLENPTLIGGEQGARDLILDEYGIDPATPKEEWSITQQNKVLVAARNARKAWDELKSKVVVPKVQTPEEREAELVRTKEERKVQLKPLRETFSKFDKFTEEIEPGKVFELNVPDEYKQGLPDMFETYFVEAGLEANEESLKDIEELKQALLLRQNFKQIYKIIEGDVTTRLKAEQDKLLGNIPPANTQTATQGEDEKTKYSKEKGLGALMGK